MFEENVKKLRERQGMPQAELARLIGVSQVAVAKYENGTAIPNIKTGVRLAQVLHTTVEQLVNAKL